MMFLILDNCNKLEIFSYIKEIYDNLEDTIKNVMVYNKKNNEYVEYRKANNLIIFDIIKYIVDENLTISGIKDRYCIEYIVDKNEINIYKYNDFDINENKTVKKIIANFVLEECGIVTCKYEDGYKNDLEIYNSIYKIYDAIIGNYGENIGYNLMKINEIYTIFNKWLRDELFKEVVNELNLDKNSFFMDKLNLGIKIEIDKYDNDNTMTLYIEKENSELKFIFKEIDGYPTYTMFLNNNMVIACDITPTTESITINTIKEKEMEKIKNILSQIIVEYGIIYRKYQIKISKGANLDKKKEEIDKILFNNKEGE